MEPSFPKPFNKGVFMVQVKVCGKSDLSENGRIAFSKEGKEIVVFCLDGDFYAIDRYCTHAGGDLLDAKLEGKVVVCPVHEATFDLETGKLAPSEYLSPHLARVIKQTRVYPVVVKGDEIFIELD
jgi:nitrite reductase/ring-hydroxylating ferredoxin subunit